MSTGSKINAMVKRFIHLFTLSCKQATYLIEKRLHTSLSRTERLRLSIHFALCKLCREYDTKAALIDGWLRTRKNPENCDCIFEDEQVERFKAEVKEKMKQ